MADIATPAKARVLVVDDSSLVRLYYRSALETAGFEVKQAINGIEAMEKVLSESFDLVIVDVNMPRMDGFTFLRSLRSGAADVATLPALDDFDRIRSAGYRGSQSGRCEFLSREAGGGSRTGSACLCSHGSHAVSALQEQFVTEARELIRQATDNLIALERDGTSPERVDSVFRAFHTLKGSAGVVELPAMSIMLHAAEDLLDSVRHGTLGASAEIVDAALVCLDQVSRWVDNFEAAGALPSRAGEDGRAMAERLRSLLPGRKGEQSVLPAPNPLKEGGQGPLPEWVSRLIAAERDAMTSRMPEGPMVATAISYEPFAGCFYNGDDPLQLMQQVPGLLAFHIEPREPFVPLADIDPYACNLRLRAISAANRDEIASIFRLVPDQIQIISIPPEALPAAEIHITPGDQSLVRKVIEAQCELLRVPGRTDGLAGCVGAAARVAENALRHGRQLHLADTVGRAGALALAQHDAGPLLSALERTLAAFASAPSTMVADGGGRPNTTVASERPTDRVLRVSEAKIEALVNLAGELVVARNALSYSARQVEKDLGGREVARSIQRDRDAIDRLVTELHGTVLQLRMVPVAQLFGSFPRLVRDVARQLHKKVALVTHGETTEVDKTIMDRLFEPMVHLVRNALDHGVEDPEQRRAAGKSEAATISIAASRSGDRLLVEVTDDGRGIDPAVVRRTASEKLILSPDELTALTDEGVVDLVFAAGFSTASIGIGYFRSRDRNGCGPHCD